MKRLVQGLVHVSLGLVVALLPIAAHYTAAGQLGRLIRAFVLNEWGWRYVAQAPPSA